MQLALKRWKQRNGEYISHHQVNCKMWNYQETTKQISANVQLEFDRWGPLLQQIHPVVALMIIWATIRATAAVNPRPIAGLLGYVHVEGEVSWTWEPCHQNNNRMNETETTQHCFDLWLTKYLCTQIIQVQTESLRCPETIRKINWLEP